MMTSRHIRTLVAVAVVTCLLGATTAGTPGSGVDVRVAMLAYGEDQQSSVCFSDEFLDALRFETDIRVARDFTTVPLGSNELYEHPFALFTGEGAFALRDDEVERLRQFLAAGGFVLASAGCSNAEWDASFRALAQSLVPGKELVPLPLEHDALQTVFSIAQLETKKPRPELTLWGIEIEGRLALVYSPEGLNDSESAGGGCCCCGGSEILNARYINANVLAYALMH